MLQYNIVFIDCLTFLLLIFYSALGVCCVSKTCYVLTVFPTDSGIWGRASDFL